MVTVEEGSIKGLSAQVSHSLVNGGVLDSARLVSIISKALGQSSKDMQNTYILCG